MGPQTIPSPQYSSSSHPSFMGYVAAQGAGFPGLMYSGGPHHHGGVWGADGQGADPMVALQQLHSHPHHHHPQQQQQEQDPIVQVPIPISFADAHHHHHLHYHHSQQLSHETAPLSQPAGPHPLPIIGSSTVSPCSPQPRQTNSYSTPPPPPLHISANSPFSVDFLLGQRGVAVPKGAPLFHVAESGNPSLPPSLVLHHDPPPDAPLVRFGLSEGAQMPPAPSPYMGPLEGTHFAKHPVQDGTFADNKLLPYHDLHVAMETCPPDVAGDDEGSRLGLELPPEKPFSPPGLLLCKGEDVGEERDGEEEEDDDMCSPPLPLQHREDLKQPLQGDVGRGGIAMPEGRAKSQTGSQTIVAASHPLSQECSGPLCPPTATLSHPSGPQSITVQPMKPVAVATESVDNNTDDDDDVFLPDSPQQPKPNSKGHTSSCGEGPAAHRRGRTARNADLVKLQLPLGNG